MTPCTGPDKDQEPQECGKSRRIWPSSRDSGEFGDFRDSRALSRKKNLQCPLFPFSTFTSSSQELWVPALQKHAKPPSPPQKKNNNLPPKPGKRRKQQFIRSTFGQKLRKTRPPTRVFGPEVPPRSARRRESVPEKRGVPGSVWGSAPGIGPKRVQKVT